MLSTEPLFQPLVEANSAGMSSEQPLSIADSVKEAAEAVVQQQQEDMLRHSGYVFDTSTSLYYHAETGYYYDMVRKLNHLEY